MLRSCAGTETGPTCSPPDQSSGYTDKQNLSLRDEPEAVSPEAQKAITATARRSAEARRLEAWLVMSQTVNRTLDEFVGVVRDQRLASGVRLIRKTTHALGRQVGA